MTRPTALQTIRALAAKSLLEPAPQVVRMADLSYVARHILRLLAGRQKATATVLQREIGEGDLTPALLTLVRYQLVELAHRSYRITDAGIDCVSAVPPPAKALPRTTAGAGTYAGAELRHRSA